jgi:leucyl aminopeptidase
MSQTGTRFEFRPEDRQAPAADVLMVPLVVDPPPALELVSQADALCNDAISELLELKAVGSDAGHISHTTRPGAYRRIAVVSLGSAEKLTVGTIRKAAGAAARWLIGEKLSSAALTPDGLIATGLPRVVGEWAGAMRVAGFRFADYKKPDDKVPSLISVRIRCREPEQARRLMPEIQRELIIADAINYARQLAHQPANRINPTTLAAEARKLAAKYRLKCTVIDAAAARRLGMNGLLAVGAGASEPPCLIQLEYRRLPKSRQLTALVGKAITFDSGGYSIKPAAGLESLKYDKCGGATVMAILKAAAELKLRCNLVGIVAAAENALSDRAYRPGDILKMMSGKTVEVISTDAEGRLVLADALWYAQEKLQATEIIDLATLTGGASVALGRAAAAIMSNDDELAGRLGECGRVTHERLWRLPLWDEYRDLIKGTDTDLKNASGKRDAQTIVGGMFLKEFIRDKTAWAPGHRRRGNQ